MWSTSVRCDRWDQDCHGIQQQDSRLRTPADLQPRPRSPITQSLDIVFKLESAKHLVLHVSTRSRGLRSGICPCQCTSAANRTGTKRGELPMRTMHTSSYGQCRFDTTVFCTLVVYEPPCHQQAGRRRGRACTTALRPQSCKQHSASRLCAVIYTCTRTRHACDRFSLCSHLLTLAQGSTTRTTPHAIGGLYACVTTPRIRRADFSIYREKGEWTLSMQKSVEHWIL